MRIFGIGKKSRRRMPSRRRKVVYYRDGCRCRYCGRFVTYRDYHIDHIKPVSYGGNDYVFNLACACASCNLSRGNKHWIKPEPLGIFRTLFGLVLIIMYMDLPGIEDFT